MVGNAMSRPEIVGLDLSLTSTGIAAREVKALQVTAKGMLRLSLLRNAILEILSLMNDPLVVVEGYSFGSRNSQAHAAGELGGVIRWTLWENQIPYVDVPPTSRAKFATGKGNASKSEVVSSVSAKTGIIWSGKGADDCCDAWVLREMGLAHLGRSEFTWPKINLSALEKIDWSPFDGLDLNQR
jgi:Holliday junction resolvasome RuvABC endonuclease subunit